MLSKMYCLNLRHTKLNLHCFSIAQRKIITMIVTMIPPQGVSISLRSLQVYSLGRSHPGTQVKCIVTVASCSKCVPPCGLGIGFLIPLPAK